MKSYDELKALIEQRGVHAVFGDAGEGLAIEQNAAELAEFLVHMQALGVSSVLEVGTGYKAGLARFLNDDMGYTVTSLDIKDYGHSFSGITFMTPFPPTMMAFNVGYLGMFDLVLIDADHSYEGVRNDHQLWGGYATKVIAFHDIAGLRDCEGVRDYWNTITYVETGGTLPMGDAEIPGVIERPGYHEIIAPTPERGGIGYIVLAETVAEPLTEADIVFEEQVKAPVKKPATPRKPAAKKPAARKTPARTTAKK